MKRLLFLGALLAGCAHGPSSNEADAAVNPACAEYVAAYESCLDCLGPEARAAGDVALAAAKEQWLHDPDMGPRCSAAAAQLNSSCR